MAVLRPCVMVSEPVRHAQAPRKHGRLTVQPERRGRAPLAHDLDVAPPDAAAPPVPSTFITASLAAKRAA